MKWGRGENGKAFSGCSPFVAIVQSADLRQLDYRTHFRWLNGTFLRGVFGKRKMSTRTPVIPEKRLQDPPQRGFINTMMWSKHSRLMDPISRST
ncbi:MAG TPA: hypothetical protein VG206_04100 [Terriglobia bacterium]|nr:hypothetical protein [Terriglobia bacterium]